MAEVVTNHNIAALVSVSGGLWVPLRVLEDGVVDQVVVLGRLAQPVVALKLHVKLASRFRCLWA